MTASLRHGLARTAGALLLAAVLGAQCCGLAQAHQINLSRAQIVMGPDRTVDVEVAMKGSDVDRVAGTKVYDEHTGLVRPDALAAAAPAIAAYITTHAVVMGAEGPLCHPGRTAVAPDGDGVVAKTRWSCAGVAGPLRYRSTVLIRVSPDARQVVLLGTGKEAGQDLLDKSHTEITLTAEAQPSLSQVIERFVWAGMDHIFIGYDHICFLIAIILWSRRLWPVVKIVTAFTIAHSVTLSLAALDIVRIPSSITEPAIALTIVYVAAENFFSRDVGKRWRITFAFGFIHGFGFASALQEFGLPRSALVPALASFNIGVEIGQIAIVSLIMPLLLLLDRVLTPKAAPVVTRPAVEVYAVSGVILLFGAYWFLERTVMA